jgi:hypothetical protein
MAEVVAFRTDDESPAPWQAVRQVVKTSPKRKLWRILDVILKTIINVLD